MAGIGTAAFFAALRVLALGGLARYHTRGASEVRQFELELARFVGVRHALGVNSGTSALVCALVGAGVGPGDEVLVPAYTWVSSAAAALAVGAVPVLVEIDRSLTMDPVDLERKITPRSRAVIPVHMLNLVCDMDAIMAVAARHGLRVIEDACQAIGASYRGRRVGSIGHAGAYSFNQHKNIQAGEGGAIVTNDERILARALMYHDVGCYTRPGRAPSNEPLFVGVNLRMPELTGAILRPQLRRLEAQMARRRARRRLAVEVLSRSAASRFEVSPHHDPASAVGLTLTFHDPWQARAFADARGVSRLIDTGRHVYTNWESVLARRSAHPRLDPYAWVEGEDLGPRPDACPRTLEILARTCSVSVRPDVPLVAYRALLHLMTRAPRASLARA